MESIDDKSKVTMFVKHSPHICLKEMITKNTVILVKNALRKVFILYI